MCPVAVRKRLVGRRAFIRFHARASEERLSERYRRYVEGVHVRSWKRWLLSEVHGDRQAPADVKQGVDQLQAFGGIVDRRCLEACISYHDHRRLFPVGVLLPEGWGGWAMESPPILTIAHAEQILRRHGRTIPENSGSPMRDETHRSALNRVVRLGRLRTCMDCQIVFDLGRSKRKVCSQCHAEGESIRLALFGRRRGLRARRAARLRLCIDCRESFAPGRSQRKVCDRCHAENERIRTKLFGARPRPKAA
jgi:hypothetical protein